MAPGQGSGRRHASFPAAAEGIYHIAAAQAVMSITSPLDTVPEDYPHRLRRRIEISGLGESFFRSHTGCAPPALRIHCPTYLKTTKSVFGLQHHQYFFCSRRTLLLSSPQRANMNPVSLINHPCTVCCRPTSMWCSRCQTAWYCSPDHLQNVSITLLLVPRDLS